MTNTAQFYEGCGREGPIRCIFLSEFHPVAGSKITCQVPEEYVTKEVFDAVNVYIIPKPQLQRCVLTVNALGYKIVGYPVRIDDDQRYVRNAFYFNLCFVCDSWARTVQYEPVVKKLSEYFIMMENETSFLSRDDKSNLSRVLNKVVQELNERRVTTIIEGETTIYLKIVSHINDPPKIHDHLVPILLPPFQEMSKEIWDLTTQQVLPYVNGTNHITRIASDSDVEIGLVKSCIQNLVYYNVVQVIPLLKYSNVYMCTRNLQNLTIDSKLAQRCRRYVAIEPPTTTPPPSLHKILQMYSIMTHGVTLKSLCMRVCPRDNNIDERKLVTFGLQHSFIRCVNKYPVCISDSPSGRHKIYSGQHSVDEICCKTDLTPARIQEDVDSDAQLLLLSK